VRAIFRACRDSEAQRRFQEKLWKLIGAYLYLRSISAARGRRNLWNMFAIAIAFLVYWLRTHVGFCCNKSCASCASFGRPAWSQFASFDEGPGLALWLNQSNRTLAGYEPER
jgi:hypothetical protein